MKSKYEEFKVLYIFIFIIVSLFFIISYFLFNIKISKYKVFNGIVVDDNIVVYVDKNDKKLFFSNKKLCISGDDKTFEIEDINKVNNGYEIILDVSYKYKDNEVISFSILSNKIYFYKIFNVIWR